jgi:hypothetical protein
MMAFKGMLMKDWILGRRNLAFAALLQLAAVFIAYLLAHFFHEPGVLFLSGFLIIMFHGISFTVLLLSFLNLEGKTQLWLYNPNSTWVLLGAKMTISLLFQIISVLFACCVGYIVLHFLPKLFDYPSIKEVPGMGDLLAIAAEVTLSGIALTVLIMFLWVVYHSLKQVRFIKHIRWLIVFLLFILLTISWSFLMGSHFMAGLQDIAVITFDTRSGFNLSETGGLEFEVTHNQISPFAILLYIVALGVLFWLSALTLDRKVEV